VVPGVAFRSHARSRLQGSPHSRRERRTYLLTDGKALRTRGRAGMSEAASRLQSQLTRSVQSEAKRVVRASRSRAAGAQSATQGSAWGCQLRGHTPSHTACAFWWVRRYPRRGYRSVIPRHPRWQRRWRFRPEWWMREMVPTSSVRRSLGWANRLTTTSCGCPKRLFRPAEMIDRVGCTARRNLDVEEVLLPWCATLRTSTSRSRTPR
jgi:hypothetical protein